MGPSIDRDKVIKEFELFIKEFHPACTSEGVELDMFREVLALLKEQEAVKPTWSRGKPFCGACGLRIHGGKFCSECGKPILWESRLYCINCGKEAKWE